MRQDGQLRVSRVLLVSVQDGEDAFLLLVRHNLEANIGRFGEVIPPAVKEAVLLICIDLERGGEVAVLEPEILPHTQEERGCKGAAKEHALSRVLGSGLVVVHRLVLPLALLRHRHVPCEVGAALDSLWDSLEQLQQRALRDQLEAALVHRLPDHVLVFDLLVREGPAVLAQRKVRIVLQLRRLDGRDLVLHPQVLVDLRLDHGGPRNPISARGRFILFSLGKLKPHASLLGRNHGR
mmetsp:Transcript_42323/g.102140  ORF Transcript_42323/g.102140 Transcript_42323/m.102140 type:complete len:237 (-) Transcript_42323:121-831(-)